MLALDGTRAHVEGRGEDPPCADRIEQPRRPANIRDRVRRARFVEVHLLERDAMDLRFRLAESSEDLDRAVTHRGGEPSALDDLRNLAEIALLLVGPDDDHVDLRRRQARGRDPAPPQLEAALREPGEGGAERLIVRAEIDEGAEDHVSARPRERVEIERLHGAPS